jgi:hypothetical protein
MDIHRIIESTLRVTEDEMMQANEPMAPEAPVEPEAAEEPIVSERPEITPELVDSLIADMPELADCDKEMLMKGMTSELEHFDTVGGDIAIVARIACDHIKEFPGKDYYAALDQMEHELKETPGEEEAEHAPGGEEVSGETPAGEDMATETPKQESPFESKKEPKEDEQVEMKKESNKKEEDRINKEAAKK